MVYIPRRRLLFSTAGSGPSRVQRTAVFGGSPFINQALNPAVTLRENIIGTILNPMSPVYLYASQLVFSDNALNINAERIFSALGNDRKRYTEIEDALGVKKPETSLSR